MTQGTKNAVLRTFGDVDAETKYNHVVLMKAIAGMDTESGGSSIFACAAFSSGHGMLGVQALGCLLKVLLIWGCFFLLARIFTAQALVWPEIVPIS